MHKLTEFAYYEREHVVALSNVNYELQKKEININKNKQNKQIKIKNIKTVEDDFNAPLLQLNLISKTNRRNESGELVYKINLGEQSSISPYLFMYIICDSFENETVINLDSIRKILGSFLCLSLDSLENLISQICTLDNRFVYKDDAGIKQLQIKTNTPDFKQDLLSSIYENQ